MGYRHFTQIWTKFLKYLNINISSSSSIWLILTNSLPSWHLIPNFQNSPNWVFNSVWLHWNPPSDLNVISYSDKWYICILQLYVFIFLQIQHKNETFLYKKICSLWINCRPYARTRLVSNNKLINKYVLSVFKKWVKIKIYTSDLIMFNHVLLYTPKNQSYNTR